MICVKHSIITTLTTGAYAGFLRGRGAQLKKFSDLGSACREPLLWGFGGMQTQENLLKWCNFVRFEGYFQPLS